LWNKGEKRFIAKRVTDINGKFRFVVPEKKYSLKLLDEGFDIMNEEKKYTTDRRFKDMLVISSNLVLQRAERDE